MLPSEARGSRATDDGAPGCRSPHRRSALSRLQEYLHRPELRTRPVSTLLRRSYFEIVKRAAPSRLDRLHRSRLRTTDYVFLAPLAESVGRSLFLYGVYEPLATAAFSALLAEGDVAIDVGAHYGDFTLAAAFKVGTPGMVLAFEPQPAVRSILTRNVELNGLSQVRVLDHALADYDGTAALYTAADPIHTGGASLSPEHVGQSERYIDVVVRRLDEAVDRAAHRRVAAIKIDVEGAEAAVLRGATAVLQAARPAILFEVNGLPVEGTESESMSLLRDGGYDLFGIVADPERGFRLVRVPPGADPRPFREAWLALNLLGVSPGSTTEARLAARGHLD